MFEIIYDTLYTYNYKIKHSSIGYFPIELKDTTNPELIKTVKNNIENRYKQFHNNDDSKYLIGSKYLLIEEGNIVNKKSKIIYKPKIKNISYTVPVTNVSSDQGGLIKIKIEKENKYYN